MAQDISLLNAQYQDVPSVLLPKTGGGTAQFDDTTDANATASDILSGKTAYVNGIKLTGTGSGGGGGAYAWFGEGAEKVGTIINKTINLHSDTTYDSWTPSTTAGTIKASSTTADYTLSADFNSYDYLFAMQGFIEPVYQSVANKKNFMYRNIRYQATCYYGYPNHTNNTESVLNNTVTTYTSNATSINGYLYYFSNNSGTMLTAASSAYGIYTSAIIISLTQTGAGLYDIAIKLGALNAVCNSNRFSTTAAAAVDTTATNYYVTVDLYRCPHYKSWASHLVDDAVKRLNAS